MFVQLIYTSSATRDLSDEELAAILKTAVENNRRLDITGLLLYTKGTFMQVLEGESAVIDSLLKTIKADPRHHRVEEQMRTPVKEREFDQWHMGYRVLSNNDVAALPNYAPFFEDGFDATRLAAQPGICLDIMRVLADLPG